MEGTIRFTPSDLSTAADRAVSWSAAPMHESFIGTASVSVGAESEGGGGAEVREDREALEGARLRLPMDVGTGGAVRAREPGAFWLEGAAAVGDVPAAAAAPARVREGLLFRDVACGMSLCLSGCRHA